MKKVDSRKLRNLWSRSGSRVEKVKSGVNKLHSEMLVLLKLLCPSQLVGN